MTELIEPTNARARATVTCTFLFGFGPPSLIGFPCPGPRLGPPAFASDRVSVEQEGAASLRELPAASVRLSARRERIAAPPREA